MKPFAASKSGPSSGIQIPALIPWQPGGRATGIVAVRPPARIGGRLAAGAFGLVCLVAPVCAEPAGLDGSFGSSGTLAAAIGAGDEAAHAAVMLADGKILLAGYSWNGTDNDFMVARFLPAGAPDPAFSAVVTPIGSGDDIGRALAVQSDGKILVAGSTHNGTNYDFALVRYLADGTPDPGFGTGGKVTTAFGTGNDHARAVAVQSDGKIVVAGYARIGATDDIAVVRYLDSGALDPGFSTDGKATLGTTSSHDYGLSVALNSGKVIVGGYAKVISTDQQLCAVVRFTAAGAVDNTFNTVGVVNTSIGGTEDRIHAIALQSDGKIVAAGYAENNFSREIAVLRYNTNGGLDGTFGDSGIVTTAVGTAGATANALLIQSDQKIVVAGEAVGSNTDFAVVRYLTNGTLDAGFCGAGKAVVPVGTGTDSSYGVALQSDGKVVLVGATYNGSNYDLGLARLLGTPVPEIEVEQPAGTLLSDGVSGIAFGSVPTNGSPMPLSFTVRNAGSATLGNLALTMHGADAADFTPGALGATSLAPGAATTFTVSFVPGAAGPRTATLRLASNDTNENPFDITLTGTGIVVPLPEITTTSLPKGMVGAPYNLAFAATGGFPPYTWQLDSGTPPADLTLSGAGILAGTPTAATDYQGFQVRVTDAQGGSASKQLGMTIIPAFVSGATDITFGTGGVVVTPVGDAMDSAQAVVVDRNTKIVVAGYARVGATFDFAVVRYFSDGTPDSSFGSNGMVTNTIGFAADYGRCVAVQSDGGILVAGEAWIGGAYDIGIVRLLSDGTLDPSFGTGGKAIISVSSGNDYPKDILIQSDGKIIVACAAGTDFGLVRLNANGTPDTSFGMAGQVVTDFNSGSYDYAEAAALQSDGRIIVAGRGTGSGDTDFILARYLTTGALDGSFGTGGKLSTAVGAGTTGDYCHSLTVQSDGKILAAGYVTSGDDFAVVRYLVDGSLDPSFGTGGKVISGVGSFSDRANGVAVHSDGSITVAGYSDNGQNHDFSVARFLANGSPDTAFGSGGRVITAVRSGNDRGNAVAVQSDGRIIVAGESNNGTDLDFAVVRYIGPLTPEIMVLGPTGQNLKDGVSSDYFGYVGMNSPPAVRIIRVFNTGTAPLTGLNATIDGATAGDFVVAQLPTTSLAPGASTSLQITFTPTVEATRNAVVHIASNDPDENPFDFGLVGYVAGSALSAWRIFHFGNEENTGDGADTNDFDHDGLANLLEYAFAGDPKSANPGIQPLIPPLGGQRAIAFRCDASRTDISYTVQASATLAAGSWSDIARSTGGATVQPLNGLSTVSDSGVGLRVATVTPAAGVFPLGKGFLRVKVAGGL